MSGALSSGFNFGADDFGDSFFVAFKIVHEGNAFRVVLMILSDSIFKRVFKVTASGMPRFHQKKGSRFIFMQEFKTRQFGRMHKICARKAENMSKVKNVEAF